MDITRLKQAIFGITLSLLCSASAQADSHTEIIDAISQLQKAWA